MIFWPSARCYLPAAFCSPVQVDTSRRGGIDCSVLNLNRFSCCCRNILLIHSEISILVGSETNRVVATWMDEC